MRLLRFLFRASRLIGGSGPSGRNDARVALLPRAYSPQPGQQPVHGVESPSPAPAHARPRVLKGKCYVIDGDTIIIRKQRIRIAGIDAPELEHPYGKASKWAMHRLCKGQVIRAEVTDELSYGRLVATCYLPDGRDLAAELVKAGLAVDWPKYSGGRYRAFEAPDLRRKLWRCGARQKGRMAPADFGAASMRDRH